ncbi:homeobox protein ceh-30-like [Pocillopora verrucosa]|uniref:homeobox protein ceh-30-like n=1 Tax=Pocillopora verrucosa TaxID=203993 RepID=UPI0033403876
MEEYATALKNSVSLAMGPVKLKDEFSHRKSSFMVEDIVRNQNFSPCPERRLPDPSFRDEMQTPQAMASGGRSSNMPSSCEEPSPVNGRSSKSRSSFTVEQVMQLERVFERQKYLGSRDRQRLAEQLQMSETQVKTWFQNRRMKMKKKLSEANERRAKISFLDNLACMQQTGYHGYQTHQPYPPPCPPPEATHLLHPSLPPPECAWLNQSPFTFPPNQPFPRYLPPPPPSWESLPEHMIDRCASVLGGFAELEENR